MLVCTLVKNTIIYKYNANYAKNMQIMHFF